MILFCQGMLYDVGLLINAGVPARTSFSGSSPQ
jgi:hypothetical protein